MSDQPTVTDVQAVELLIQIEAGLDNIDQGITVFDKDLQLVFANKRLGELLDVPQQLLTRGSAFEDLIRYNSEHGEYGPGDVEEQVKGRVKVAREFRAHTVERVRPNGRVIRVSGAPLAKGGFATIYTDITQQRHHETELQRRIEEQTRDLRRSEERLRLIANEVPAGIAYLDHDEVFQFVNRRFAQSYGHRIEDVVGRNTHEILASSIHDVSAPYFARAKLGEAVEFDLDFSHIDGRELDIRTFLRPDLRIDKTVRGFYVLSINLTKQRAAAQALSQAQKMEAIGRLSSGISHDFNNLLTIILGNLRPLAQRVEDDELVREMIGPSLRAAKRGAELTQQLLTVARRQPLDAKVVNVRDVFDGLAELLKPSLPSNITLGMTIEGQSLFARVDPGQMENALLNLALNAKSAIDDAGKSCKGQINLMARSVTLDRIQADRLGLQAGEFLEISCEDTGAGMSLSVQKQIFDPFFSTRNEAGGTGLGLSMAQSFVEVSDGNISVQSEVGKGTVFTILIPRVFDSPSDTRPLQPEYPANFDGQIALLVEDQEEVRKVLRRDLVELGFLVVEAEDGEEAKELIHSVDEIDLLLSDISMPGQINGVELAQLVAKEYPLTSIVLMTGQAQIDQDQSIRFPLLRKPFEQNRLIDAIQYAQIARSDYGDMDTNKE
ncbi:hybrid sensor histidine kinase/response regulator [Maritalea sp.]|uniref:hybrid sensor histidine kinase/response regulator n=1 Tax=Maritalea sp. TaxID=2003361 RepID=UPI003EF18330